MNFVIPFVPLGSQHAYYLKKTSNVNLWRSLLTETLPQELTDVGFDPGLWAFSAFFNLHAEWMLNIHHTDNYRPKRISNLV